MRITRLGNTSIDAASGKVDSDQAILAALFGDEGIPKMYDASKTYNRDDKVAAVDDTGNLQIYVALENGITGDFNSAKWGKYQVGASTGFSVVKNNAYVASLLGI